MATIGLNLRPEHELEYVAVRAEVAARPPAGDARDGHAALVAAHAFLSRVRAVHPRGSFLTTAEAASAAGVARDRACDHATTLRSRGLWPYRDPPTRIR